MFQWQKHGEKNQTKQNSYNGDDNRINRYPAILNDKATYIILQWLQSKTNPGVPSSKPLGDSKVYSAFHPSEVD